MFVRKLFAFKAHTKILYTFFQLKIFTLSTAAFYWGKTQKWNKGTSISSLKIFLISTLISFLSNPTGKNDLKRPKGKQGGCTTWMVWVFRRLAPHSYIWSNLTGPCYMVNLAQSLSISAGPTLFVWVVRTMVWKGQDQILA